MPDEVRPEAPDRGFTLIELMIVIAIIAVVAAIAVPNLLASKLSANEASAIATLRNIVSCQVMIQASARIDIDNDGNGEFGTILEMTGRVGVRRGNAGGVPVGGDFSGMGGTIEPPVLSPSLYLVDSNGWVTKAGFAFMLFLPDSSDPANFVHEVNAGSPQSPSPALSSAGQSGGTGKVGVDLSENLWCAYAVPVSRGNTGNRAFFASQGNDVLQSLNDVAKHSGTATAIAGNSAFLNDSFTSRLAVGTVGMDGDVWKIAN